MINKMYSILITVEVKARNLESALKKLGNIKSKKKYRVIKMEYRAAVNK